jgi:flavorubredoxin
MKVPIADDIYWVGVIDWNLRDFHGYTTSRGSSYNAYLIQDEKTALVDTVKYTFTDELVRKNKELVTPEKIDYIIVNHVENGPLKQPPNHQQTCQKRHHHLQ